MRESGLWKKSYSNLVEKTWDIFTLCLLERRSDTDIKTGHIAVSSGYLPCWLVRDWYHRVKACRKGLFCWVKKWNFLSHLGVAQLTFCFSYPQYTRDTIQIQPSVRSRRSRNMYVFVAIVVVILPISFVVGMQVNGVWKETFSNLGEGTWDVFYVVFLGEAIWCTLYLTPVILQSHPSSCFVASFEIDVTEVKLVVRLGSSDSGFKQDILSALKGSELGNFSHFCIVKTIGYRYRPLCDRGVPNGFTVLTKRNIVRKYKITALS